MYFGEKQLTLGLQRFPVFARTSKNIGVLQATEALGLVGNQAARAGGGRPSGVGGGASSWS